MFPETSETVETSSDNSTVLAANANHERCCREMRTDNERLDNESSSEKGSHQEVQLTTSTIESSLPSISSFNKSVVPVPNEERIKDQILIFTVSGEMKNCSNIRKSLPESKNDDREAQICRFFWNRTRHIILLISTLCLMMILSNILILNVTIICMTNPGVRSAAEEISLLSTSSINGSVEEQNETPEFTYTPMMKSSLFASMSGAAVLIVPVSVYLVKRLGARRAFILAGMLSAISTAFMPMAAYSGVSAFIIARIGQGIPLAFNLPIIGSITSGWSTVKYSGIFMAIASGFVQLAPVFTMPMAGIVCASSLGWPMVYYIHAAVTILLFTLWAIFYKDSPQRQPLITKKELDVITFGKSPPISHQRAPILAIFTSPAVWAIWLTVFANFAGMQLFVIFMPVYMHKILGLPLKTASILAALPPLSQMFIKLLAVYLSDHVKFFSSTSLTSKLRLFNSISSLGGGLLLLILAFIPTSNLLWSLIFLIISSSMLGFNTSGVFRSTSLVAKQHAYLVTGVIQFIYCFVLLTMPFAIDALAATRPNNDWSMVFVIIAFLLTFTNIFFCAFGKGSPAPWAGSTISKSINKVQPAQISTISGAA